MPPTRDQHYYFAHYAMRDLAHESPEHFLEVLSGEKAAAFLADLWKNVGMMVNASVPTSGSALQASVRPIQGGFQLGLIRMPNPESITEVHWVGVAVAPARRKLLVLKSPAVLRYITLEYSEDDKGEPCTMLCEWKREEDGFSHVNFGAGPPPREPAFVEAIENLLKHGGPAPEAGMGFSD